MTVRVADVFRAHLGLSAAFFGTLMVVATNEISNSMLFDCYNCLLTPIWALQTIGNYRSQLTVQATSTPQHGYIRQATTPRSYRQGLNIDIGLPELME